MRAVATRIVCEYPRARDPIAAPSGSSPIDPAAIPGITRRPGPEAPRVRVGGAHPVEFRNILYRDPESHEKPPADGRFLVDLNLDQVIEGIRSEGNGRDLDRALRTPLASVEAVAYRQEVFRDLEHGEVRTRLAGFADSMAEMRRHLRLAETLDFRIHRQGWFLHAAHTYCCAVTELVSDLADLPLESRALRDFRRHVAAYARSDGFRSLARTTGPLVRDLSAVTYSVYIRGREVEVRVFGGEPDLGTEVQRAFAPLSHGASRVYVAEASGDIGPSRLKRSIAACLARLFPGVFARLDAFCEEHREFADDGIIAFDSEVQFYLAYLAYIEPLREQGLGFCYPEVSADVKEVCSCDGFDLALAKKLADEGRVVVPNSFRLEGHERVFVVTGANQGGKTTFARMIGQVHYLASLGCPVPGRAACVPLCDELLTHFEKEEDLSLLRGKLQDELIRLQELLGRATPSSLLIVNEVFASTTADDARVLGREVLARLLELGLVAVWVTFIEELASFDARVVSVVSTVDPVDPLHRTFRLLRRPADGRAHALAIAKAHRLTYEDLRARLRP